MIAAVLVGRCAENHHARDVAIISFITGAKVGDHPVAFVIAPIVIAGR